MSLEAVNQTFLIFSLRECHNFLDTIDEGFKIVVRDRVLLDLDRSLALDTRWNSYQSVLDLRVDAFEEMALLAGDLEITLVPIEV